ncbi:hypothetical protein L195_g006214, partial [Trifolium pratense]
MSYSANPDTLVARIFKARIGDGSKIKVMHDPWLRGERNSWCNHLKSKCKGIACLVWKEETHGNYTLSTGYSLLMQEKEEMQHRGNAFQRKCDFVVQCPSICQLCEEGAEDHCHILFDCPESRQSWAAAGITRFGIMKRVRQSNWQQQSWQPPRFGWLKCNVDAWFQDHHGWVTNRGWCIRNDAGLFMYAGTAWDESNHTIIEAEALALMLAMQAASNMHMEHIVFESDSQLVAHLLASEFSALISSIKNFLALNSNFE